MALTLYHMAPSRSSIVLWMLEELGEPYELRVLDGGKGQHKRPDYLALNPMGKVPSLDHDGVVITEAAAIVCYLADAFPRAGLAVPIGDRRRGPYLKWLFFGPGCLEGALTDRMLKREPGPSSALGYGDFDTTFNVVGRALEPGPYLLGDAFTAADIVIGSGLRWGSMIGVTPERPVFANYIARLEDRPAFRRSRERDAELMAAQA